MYYNGLTTDNVEVEALNLARVCISFLELAKMMSCLLGMCKDVEV